MHVKKRKAYQYCALKWLLLLIMITFVGQQFRGNGPSNASFADVKAAVLAATDLSAMQEGDSRMIRRLYGLEEDSYETATLWYPVTNMGAEELLLVRLKETTGQELVRTAMENRIAQQMDSFEGYGVSQYEMLENAVIEMQGNYILFVSASNPAAVRRAFLDVL